MPETVTYTGVEPYISLFPGEPPRPRLRVTLEHGGRSFSTVALVDSGADVSAFHTVWAHLLGLPLARARSRSIIGIAGPVAAWYLTINLIVGGKRFRARVAFTDSVEPEVGILGRDSFFMAFAVGIDEVGQRVLYQPIP